MSDSAEQWNAQLRILTGRAVEEAPQVGFSEQLDGRGRLVRLSILAESTSPRADEFIDQFVSRVAELFDPAARSLTGALRQSLDVAHDELRAWNDARMPTEHLRYGVSCLIQRDDQPALLGQAGPSLALIAGDSGTAGLRPLTLHAHTEAAAAGADTADVVAAPIGGERPTTLAFAPAPDASDGWALLLTTNAAALLDAERRVALSRLGGEETLRQLYPALLDLRDAAALAVKLGHGEGPGEPSANGESTVAETDSEASMPASGPERQLEIGSDNQARLGANPPTADRSLDHSLDRDSPSETPNELQTLVPVPLAQPQAVDWPLNPFALTVASPIAPRAAVRGSPLAPVARPLLELGQALPSLLERRRELIADRPPIASPGSGLRPASARHAGVALLAMLVILAAVTSILLGPSLLRSDEDQFQSYVEQARNGFAASQLAPSTESALLALDEALLDVEAALGIHPLDSDALQLRDEIEVVLAELRLVQSPGELSTLADLSSDGPTLALGTIRVGGGRTFVLDDAGGRVLSVSDEGAVTVIYLEGELLGLGGQLRAGTPISIAWQGPTANDEAAAGSAEEALWILDSHARLYHWTPTGVLLIPIPDLSRLGSVDAVAATAGGIYLLDAAGGAVWRYAVERAELAQPVRAIGRTDLLNARELVASVTETGEVEFLVASSDGRLRRFSADDELPLAVGLARPLISPASVSRGEQSGLIYVVDRQAGRIVAVAADGAVVSQIQSAQIAELRGAWVNESRGEIVYALPDRLLIGRLPGAGVAAE